METTGAQLNGLLTLSKESYSTLAAWVPLLRPEIRVRQTQDKIKYRI